MSIKFTKHALERLKVREISQEDIHNTLNNPDKVSDDSFGNKIAQKMQENSLIRVFYNFEGNSKVVITVYKTSKIEKYNR